MSEQSTLNENGSAVQAHLTMMQGVIARMAENSRSCKVWCVTLVAAVLVLVARTGEPQHALIALVPTLLFLCLDAYYLALERAFITSQTCSLTSCTEMSCSEPTSTKWGRWGWGRFWWGDVSSGLYPYCHSIFRLLPPSYWRGA